jgi:GTP-binding protein
MFTLPSRGLFGYRSEFLSDTRGEGVLYRTVSGYEPWAGDFATRGFGAVISTDQGKTTPYSLFHIQTRATLFVGATVPVYEGQIIGETRRPKDMDVNATRPKKLTNIRSAGKDEATILTPANSVTIEWALEWMEDDELLEVTPKSLRLRKRILPRNLRKRA